MRVGISCFLTDRSVNILDLAREAEAREFDDLWVPEHTHIPSGRQTDWPMEEGSQLPEMYKRSLDPFVALSAAASVTERITLGTSICLVAQHDPIILAKTVSTLDHLANGRLIFGVGFGWNAEEMLHHGVNPDRRRTIAREKVMAMKELWTQEEASFKGTYVNFESSWQYPKPLQTRRFGWEAERQPFVTSSNGATVGFPLKGSCQFRSSSNECVRWRRKQTEILMRSPSTLLVPRKIPCASINTAKPVCTAWLWGSLGMAISTLSGESWMLMLNSGTGI